VKFQKQLGRFSGGIQFYFYCLLYKINPVKVTKMMRMRARTCVHKTKKLEILSVSKHHQDEKYFLNLQYRYLFMGTPVL
jgi:hypothetical protein